MALALEISEEEHAYWDLVRTLQLCMNPKLFAQLEPLTQSKDFRKRMLAADAMAQGLQREKALVEKCVQTLLAMLAREDFPPVLVAICNALGHLKTPQAVAPVAALREHPDARVRMGGVFALLQQTDPLAIATMIHLSADTDSDVRNWATFGLGSMVEVDSVPIREALVARLGDAGEEIRWEAIVGLAVRGDERVAGPLLEAMKSLKASEVESAHLILEAVAAIEEANRKSPDGVWQPILEWKMENWK